MASPAVTLPLYPPSFRSFLLRLLRRIIIIRRSCSHFHRWFVLPYSNVVASPAANNGLLHLFGDCRLYDTLSIARLEARMRRLLRRMKLQRHAGIAVLSNSDLLLRKYLLRQKLRSFIIAQRRGKLSSRCDGRSTAIRETYSLRPIDYQSFLKR